MLIAIFLRSLGGLTQAQIIVLSHLSETEGCVSLLSFKSWKESKGLPSGSDIEGLLCWVRGCGVCTGDLVTQEECSLIWLRSRLTGDSLL